MFSKTASYGYGFLSFINQHLHGQRISIEIAFDLCGHKSWIISCTDIYKHTISLIGRFYQSVPKRGFP